MGTRDVGQNSHNANFESVIKTLLIFIPLVLLLQLCRANEECGYKKYATEGILYSPGYPHQYQNGMDCKWDITTPSGTEVTLQFVDFELEENFSKRRCDDFLQIVDLERKKKTPKFCGIQSPIEIKYNTNAVQLRFHSDTSGKARGFLMTWKAVMAGCSVNPTLKENRSSQIEMSSPSTLPAVLKEYLEVINLMMTSLIALGLIAAMAMTRCSLSRERRETKDCHTKLLQQMQTIQSLYFGNYGLLSATKRRSCTYSRLAEMDVSGSHEMTEFEAIPDHQNGLTNVGEENPYQTMTEF